MSIHIRIEQSDIMKALGHVRSVISRRSPVPMLNNTLLKARGDSLVLVATDLDLSIYETVPADILLEGETTVPALLLYEIVSKLPSGAKIELRQLDSPVLQLSAERAEFTLQTLDSKEFPDSELDESMSGRFTLSASVLKTMFQSVGFCMAQDAARQYLNGAYLHTVEDESPRRLRFVSTDGHRLAQHELICPEVEEDDEHYIPPIDGIIIPRKMIEELRRLLEPIDGELSIQMSFSNRKFLVDGPDWRLICRLLNGSYPNYQAVIPKGHQHSLSCERKSLIESVDRILTVADATQSIRFEASSGLMKLSAWMVDGSQGKDEIPVNFDGQYSTGFNGRFVKDICGQIKEDEVHFNIQNDPDPVIIKGKNNTATLYVLMPLRI